MTRTLSERTKLIKDAMDKLGVDSTNLKIDMGQLVYTNPVVLNSYWAIGLGEFNEYLSQPRLIQLIQSRQLDALYSLQNDLNKQIIDLGGTVDKSI